MINVLILIIAILLEAFCHAGMDSIKDYRVHISEHPFKDFWHLLQYIRIFSAIMIGFSIRSFYKKEYMWIMIIFSFIAGCVFFNLLYPEQTTWFYHLDQNINIGTSIKWLDKILGFHN